MDLDDELMSASKEEMHEHKVVDRAADIIIAIAWSVLLYAGYYFTHR